jgi:hypothetical protein
MPYEPSRGVYRYIDEQIGFPHQTSGHRPKQHLPRRDIAAEHQAHIEAQARQRNFQGTRSQPVIREEDELYEDEDIYTRPPRSAIRYTSPEEIYRSGNKRVHVQYADIPPRRTAQQQQLPPHQTRQEPAYQQERYTEGIEEVPERPGRYRRRVHIHWLTFIGIGAILALILWISGAMLIAKWTDTQNDWTYTQAFRTFSIDRAVGHNGDSSAHPSHFIVQNDKRHIIIIELPADDWSKSVIYSAPTLIGEGQEKTTATISFQVNMQTGRLDMVLHVENQTYVFTNNGTKFLTPSGQ